MTLHVFDVGLGGANDYEMTTDEIIAKARTFTQSELRLFLKLLNESIAEDDARDKKMRIKRKSSLRLVPHAKPA